MFGTLVVCLPSQHTGGDVVLKFRGKETKLTTATTSEWTTSYLAWFSDVPHEVEPVLTGYRIVLTFNLINIGGATFSTVSSYDKQIESLRSVFNSWVDEPTPQFLIYPLEHKYTNYSLSLDTLKGNDLVLAQSVSKLVQETNMVCYLSSVEREVVGEAEGCDIYGLPH